MELLAADRAMEKKMPLEEIAEYRRLRRIEATAADEAEAALAARAISDIEKRYPISPQEFWEALCDHAGAEGPDASALAADAGPGGR